MVATFIYREGDAPLICSVTSSLTLCTAKGEEAEKREEEKEEI
jgi:hypothetical protein